MLRIATNCFAFLFFVCFSHCGGAPVDPVTPEPEVDTSAQVKAQPSVESTSFVYPETAVREVTDVLHGVSIVDPFRWLEEDDDSDVQKWQADQTALARDFLDNIPGRNELRERIAQVYQVDFKGVPQRKGKYYFQMNRDADQDQPVLWVSEGLDGKPQKLIDPNESTDNTLSLDWWYASWDGELVAYGTSLSGSEHSTLYIIKTATGEKLTDQIPHTRYSYVAWLPDASGFYYTRMPAPGSDEKQFNRLFFHKLGDDPQNDDLVFGDQSSDDAIHFASISPNGKHLVVSIMKGSGGSRVDMQYKNLAKKRSKFTAVAVDMDSAFYPDVTNDKLYVVTNYKASRYRLLEMNYKKLAEKHWREIVPESEDAIDQVLIIKDHIVVKVMHNATSKIYIHDRKGKRISEIELPTLGTVGGLKGQFDDEEFFYGFASFFHPGDVYRHGLKEKKSALISRVDMPVNPERYTVKQVFYSSKDGTRIPMFMAHLKNINWDTPKPTLLTAYGGFNVAMTPYFLGVFLPLIEAGGVFAMPNLRGGSEYGEQWHRQGMLENKQNTFDDFTKAAQYLVARQFTSPQMLAIRGGSNGGLLVGAAMTQNPELYKAVICAVPLLDMLRYHMFLIAKLWIPEYGSSDDPGQFKYLKAYSPYHNVHKASYPATLFLTAVSDSRVAPLHARKMTALLQTQTTSDAPILLHVESKAGHGTGKPVSKKIEEATDILAFVMNQIGLLKDQSENN